MRKIYALICSVAIAISGSAQLPAGSLAPDFTATDINGVEHHLYDYLAQGYTVVLDISATWCGPCWSYHTGQYNGTGGEGALHVLHNDHGVDNGGNVIVIMVEGDPTTNTNCLYGADGCNSSTQGDWVTDTPYPIIDNSDIADAYQIAYYPTIYTICPNGIVTETSQITAEQHYSFIEADDCQSVFANDATLLNYSGTVGTCDEAELIVDLANLGSTPLTSLTIMVTGVTPMVNYNWTGDLGQFGIETVNLGNVTVNDGEDVIIAITNIDDNIMNNALTPAVGATEATTHIHIDLLTDVYPGDYLWEIRDDNSTVVASGGPYADFDVQMDPIQVDEDVYLPATGCYNFILIDQYGDGMYAGAHCYVYGVTSGGSAMSNILEIGDAGLLFEEVSGAAEVTEVVSVTESSVVNVLGAYPNPVADVLNVNYALTVSGQTSMSVINMLGETVMVENLGNRIQGEYTDRLDVSELPAGMYMINLNAAGNVTSFRITVK